MSKKKTTPPRHSDGINTEVENSIPVWQKRVNLLFLFLSLIPLYRLFALVNDFARNVPYMDDWDAILVFLSKWTDAHTFTEKLALLFSQHNEHRILSSRLVYVLWHSLFGEIDFVKFIYIANFQLLVIAGLLIYFAKKFVPRYWGIMALLISFCVFDPSSYENSGFAMAGMQNYGVIMLFMLSLFFYSIPSKKYWILIPAFLFQFLCAFSSGNGYMAGLALVIFAFLDKNKWKIILSSLGLVLFTTLYFWYYHMLHNTQAGKNAGDIILFFFKLAGGYFDYDYRVIASVILFLLLGVVMLYRWKQQPDLYSKELLPFVSILLFILMSMAATALFRSGGKDGIDHDSYASRYLIYPHLLAAVVFIVIAKRNMNQAVKWGLMAVVVMTYLKAYQSNYDYGEKGFRRTYDRLNSNAYAYPDTVKAKQIAIDVCNKKIYCIEEHRVE